MYTITSGLAGPRLLSACFTGPAELAEVKKELRQFMTHTKLEISEVPAYRTHPQLISSRQNNTTYPHLTETKERPSHLIRS